MNNPKDKEIKLEVLRILEGVQEIIAVNSGREITPGVENSERYPDISDEDLILKLAEAGYKVDGKSLCIEVEEFRCKIEVGIPPAWDLSETHLESIIAEIKKLWCSEGYWSGSAENHEKHRNVWISSAKVKPPSLSRSVSVPEFKPQRDYHFLKYYDSFEDCEKKLLEELEIARFNVANCGTGKEFDKFREYVTKKLVYEEKATAHILAYAKDFNFEYWRLERMAENDRELTALFEENVDYLQHETKTAVMNCFNSFGFKTKNSLDVYKLLRKAEDVIYQSSGYETKTVDYYIEMFKIDLSRKENEFNDMFKKSVQPVTIDNYDTRNIANRSHRKCDVCNRLASQISEDKLELAYIISHKEDLQILYSKKVKS